MLKVLIDIARMNHSYPVIIEPGLCRDWRREVETRIHADSYLAMVDDTVAASLGLPESGAVEGRWRYVRVRSGEDGKSIEQYARLAAAALGLGIDRRTVVVSVGGGVTSDMAGFMAATLLRGLRLAHIPTTLLAQVDSCIGGKCGLNTTAGKNQIGCFKQPEFVLVDPLFLGMLPRREIASGLGEVVKSAIIDSHAFFMQLRQSASLVLELDQGALASVIARCCRMKAGIVGPDETEQGRRTVLNLGHTFGHALERLAGFDGRVLHGEAVSVGLCLAAAFAVRKSFLPPGDQREILGLVNALGLPSRISDLGRDAATPPDWRGLFAGDGLVSALHHDKKAASGRIRLVLPHAIGDCRVEEGVDTAEVAAFMREWL